MRWQGKVIGGIVGGLVGVGPVGAALGMLLGHQFDKQAEEAEEANPDAELHRISEAFFRSAFSVMGFVAKADGRISEQEIQAAREIMQRMRLTPDQVQAAIRFFTKGKQPGFSIERAVAELRRVCGRRHDLLRMFVEIQMQASLRGHDLRGPARSLVYRIGQLLGMAELEMAHMEAALRFQQGYRPSSRAAPSNSVLADAYAVLEIQSGATDKDVIKAYRRQMSRHHPDKLVANGLPDSMQELAKEKTQRIREAYEIIRSQRGIK